MKLPALTVCACALLSLQTLAQDSVNVSPRADYLNPIRVLLYVPGTDLVFDYPDVCRIFCALAAEISFETQDGSVVTHRGTYTIIQTRNSVVTIPPQRETDSWRSRHRAVSFGPKFYDIR